MKHPVTLKTFPQRFLAQPLVDFLGDNGVEALLHADDGGGLYPNLEFIHGAQVRVDQADLVRARDLLAVFDAAPTEPLPEA